MTDMRAVIVPKSDQINADDMLAGPMTIRIAEVKVTPGTEQPVSMYFDGSEKAFRPCKSMSRVLVAVWGPDSSQYVGNSMTLYRDPKVKWGGMEVGGIRISHMTGLDGPHVMVLAESKANRKPFTVKPLAVADKARTDAESWTDARVTMLNDATTIEAIDAIVTKSKRGAEAIAEKYPDLHERFVTAEREARAAFDPFGLPIAQPEGRDNTNMGEAHTDDRITDAVIAENANA